MDINDYLIDQDGKDWPALFKDWMPPLPPSFTLWLVNRFGDIVVVLDDGSVHLLDIGAGTFTRLANDRAHFAQLIDAEGNGEKWLKIGLVDACRKAGLQLDARQCYGFKVPPMLGGQYEVANVQPADLAVEFPVLAQLYRKLASVAGAPVGSVTSKDK